MPGFSTDATRAVSDATQKYRHASILRYDCCVAGVCYVPACVLARVTCVQFGVGTDVGCG